MISSLHGAVLHSTADQVIIDVGGVGFSVAVPADVAHTATVGELAGLAPGPECNRNEVADVGCRGMGKLWRVEV